MSIHVPIPYEIGEEEMFVVYYFENKNLLLSQLRKTAPAVGDDLKIKGRKAKVSNVETVDEKYVHVQVVLEAINKTKLALDNSKKKKR